MSRSASSRSEPRERLIAAAPIAPIVAPGNANTADWLSKPIMPMTIEPKPYALRIVTSNFGDVAIVCAANMRAPARRMPRFSDAVPGSTPGLSARKTNGRWNESATVMKCDALSAPSTSIEPAHTFGWLAMIATGWPPRCAERGDHRLAEVGLHLEPRRLVDDDVDHVADVVDALAVARHDVEDLVDQPRRGVVVGVVGWVRPRRRREVAEVEAHQLERGGVVGREVLDQPAGDGDTGPAELLLGDLLPQRLGDDRRTGGEDRRVRAHHREVGHGRDERAVARPTNRSTAVISGTCPEQRDCESRSVGARP